jgi:peptide/nickel transport system substrate-binding protein
MKQAEVEGKMWGSALARGCYRARHVGRALAATVVLITSLVACSSLESSDSTSPSSGGSTLTYATAAAPRTLDILTVDDHPATELLVPDVYEPLTRVAYDPSGKVTWEPLLATSWDEVTPRQWRFHIRPDVKFHDGQLLTADDVVYSINRRLEPSSEQIGLLALIEKAVKVDDATVDVYATQDNPFVYRAMYGIPITPNGWGENNATAAAATANGTGPYKLTAYENGGNTATLTKSPDYWGTPAKLDSIKMRVIPEASAAFQALQTNEVNVVDNLTPDLVSKAPAVIDHESVLMMIARIGTENPVMKDVRVRQALNMAINRDSIINDVYHGYASPPNGQIIPSEALGYDDALTDYPYDPDQAKRLVGEAGATGKPVSVLCSSDRYGTAGMDLCQVIVQGFKDIGLQPDLKFQPTDKWTNEGLYAPKNGITPPDVFVAGAGTSDLNGGNTLLNGLTCGSDRNTYCNPGLEASIRAALAEPDANAMVGQLKALAGQVKDAAPFLFIVLPHNTWGVSANVEGTLYPIPEDVRWADWSFSS